MRRRWTRQPLLGVETAAIGLTCLGSTWVVMLSHHHEAVTASDLFLGLCLVVSVGLAYLFSIQVRQETKVGMTSVPLFLLSVLLPTPLAGTAVGLGVLAGELAIRSRTGTYLSDVAVQVGRWMLLGLAASLAVQLPGHPENANLLPLFAAALAMWLGDLLTSPLLLSPATGESPLSVIRLVARQAGPVEAAQYVVGILGVVASMQTIWALGLLVLPTALVYLSFKGATDLHERTRRLLASVVETSSDAILLLDLEGRIVTANRPAAALYGREEAEELAQTSIFQAIMEDDRPRALKDMQTTAEIGTVRTVEYTMVRQDGTTFPAELAWSSIRDRRGQPTGVTSVVRDITERKRAAELLEHRAMHDALTGLPNRIRFDERLQAALARAQVDASPFALLLTDLDRFKQVNDTFGHRCGDELLIHVAQRLQHALRETDIVARLGGDEFAILLPHADQNVASLVASRIVAAMAEPIVAQGERLDVGISVGVAVSPAHGEDAETLLQRADVAMYAAKRAHRGYALYQPQTDQALDGGSGNQVAIKQALECAAR